MVNINSIFGKLRKQNVRPFASDGTIMNREKEGISIE